jgi:hypothetical protein
MAVRPGCDLVLVTFAQRSLERGLKVVSLRVLPGVIVGRLAVFGRRPRAE